MKHQFRTCKTKIKKSIKKTPKKTKKTKKNKKKQNKKKQKTHKKQKNVYDMFCSAKQKQTTPELHDQNHYKTTQKTKKTKIIVFSSPRILLCWVVTPPY